MRWVSTLVLPDPAPATTSSGPPRWTTASSWSGLRPSVGVERRRRARGSRAVHPAWRGPSYGGGARPTGGAACVTERRGCRALPVDGPLSG